MKFTLDEDYGVMYIYFDHPDAFKASVKKTLVDIWPGVNLDIGHDNEPLGLEFMNVQRIEEMGETSCRHATPPT